MAIKQSAKLKIGIIPKGISIGLIVSMACTILGAAITAWLLVSEKLGEGSIGYITVILLLLSSILGAFTSFSFVKRKRVPICLIAGSVYFLSLLAMNALFFRGMYGGVGESALVVFAGCLSVAILGLTEGKKTKRKTK